MASRSRRNNRGEKTSKSGEKLSYKSIQFSFPEDLKGDNVNIHKPVFSRGQEMHPTRAYKASKNYGETEVEEGFEFKYAEEDKAEIVDYFNVTVPPRREKIAHSPNKTHGARRRRTEHSYRDVRDKFHAVGSDGTPSKSTSSETGTGTRHRFRSVPSESLSDIMIDRDREKHEEVLHSAERKRKHRQGGAHHPSIDEKHPNLSHDIMSSVSMKGTTSGADISVGGELASIDGGREIANSGGGEKSGVEESAVILETQGDSEDNSLKTTFRKKLLFTGLLVRQHHFTWLRRPVERVLWLSCTDDGNDWLHLTKSRGVAGKLGSTKVFHTAVGSAKISTRDASGRYVTIRFGGRDVLIEFFSSKLAQASVDGLSAVFGPAVRDDPAESVAWDSVKERQEVRRRRKSGEILKSVEFGGSLIGPFRRRGLRGSRPRSTSSRTPGLQSPS